MAVARPAAMMSSAITPHIVFAKRKVSSFQVTHFSQPARLHTPSHYHEDGTLCVLLRGAAIDRFRNKTVEFEPGTVIYRPPGERHAHQFGAAGVAAIVIEVPPFRLGSHSSLCFLSELRATSNILALADSARLIRCMTHPETFEDEAEEHCFLLLTAFNRDGEKA